MIEHWNKKHPDKCNEARARWRASHPNYKPPRESTKQVKAAYRERNRLKLKAANVEYRKRNREKVAAYAKARNRAYPQMGAKITAARRARKLGATVGDTKVIYQWVTRWKKKKRVVCYWCKRPQLGKKCHSDHIVALVNGGSHSIENLCISCPTCNLSKHSKQTSDWNQQIQQPTLL